ncbi:MAG: SDR family oxidoreductase [Betaproteobacteria bacterium]|nr:SDR family oxidoreductase [Betaproteobacteria bacterium]
MDLGIRGRWALVCASSKGLGLGCAESLAAEGVNLVMNARGAQVLEEQAKRVKAPIDVLALSNGARSGLTGFIAGLSRKTAAHNVTINNLLPGMFDTDRLRGTIKAAAAQMAVSEEEAARRRMASVPAGRFGQAHEFGQACAYLCSAQASYVTGQNFLIDGGAYPGTF